MGQISEMKTFVRVVEAGSISKAAEQLGLAKSGVSRRLAELESRLGVRLMNRTTRRSSLTEAGQSYYEGALKLLMDLSELNATTADTNACLQGTLRLAAPLSFGLLHLSPAIDEFLGLHPDLRINIDFSDRHIDLVEQGVAESWACSTGRSGFFYARWCSGWSWSRLFCTVTCQEACLPR